MWEWVHSHHEDLLALGPLATIFAAVIAATIAGVFAFLQHQIARSQRNIAYEKLKYDLFERRYAVYEAAKGMAFALRPSMERIPYESFTDWQMQLDRAAFLFPQKQAQLAERILHLSFEWEDLTKSQSGDGLRDAEAARVEKRRGEIPTEFEAILPTIDPVFLEELSFARPYSPVW